LPDPLAPAAGDVVDDPLEFGRFTRWVSGPAGERHAESALQLAGMRCAACAGIIEGALVAVPGVSAASVSARRRTRQRHLGPRAHPALGAHRRGAPCRL
jgi:hypothetical protein